LGTVPLPIALLTTITIVLAWSFILAGALHAHVVVRIIAVAAYAVVGLASGISAGSMVAAVIITLVVLSVVAAAIGLYITDRGNHRQAPHLHHRARLRLPTFGWILLATTLIYGLLAVTGLQGGDLGFFIDIQLDALQFLLIPVLVLAGTDFAEWAEVVSGRLGSLVEKLSRRAVLGAIVVAAAGILAWAYLHDGPGFSLVGTLGALAPVAIVAIPVGAIGAVALRRPTSARVPFWALGIGAITLYLGILTAATPTVASTVSSPSEPLPPLVRAQGTHSPPYSLLVPQGWSRAPAGQGTVWSGSSGGRPARLVLLWSPADGRRSLSSALAAPLDLEPEGSSAGWRAASATTSIAGQPARGEVWTRQAAGVTWTLAGVRVSGLSPASRAVFENARESFTADPGATEGGSGAASPTSFLVSASSAAVLMLVAGLALLLLGRGEVATGGLFLSLVGIFSLAGPLIAAPLIEAVGWPVGGGVAPTNLDVAGAYGGLGVVLLTSIVPGWRLAAPVLRLALVLILGFAGLHFLYDGVFGTALGAGQRFTLAQGVVLVAAMLWDVLMSGESFTNTGGLAVPRHTRVLIYLGYTLLVVTTVLFLSSVRLQGGGSTGQEFESDSYPQLGIYALGPPLLITFFLVNLRAWRRSRPLSRPDALDQVDRSVLDEVRTG
ncbi:MAG: hypothetical protein J2P43_13235, partial [Candidatus Dormibacteraeota bacterium]|nr:hypothetical protein [Candidatus Dormibacteraeota bacterium]